MEYLFGIICPLRTLFFFVYNDDDKKSSEIKERRSLNKMF